MNGFLLSELGKKVLFDHMTRFYATLSPTDKTYFTNKFEAPCPLGGIMHTKKLFFYKFLDQYLCAINKVSNLQNRAAKSANIVRNMNLVEKLNHKGMKGAYAGAEIVSVLKHLGINDYTVRTASSLEDLSKEADKAEDFVIVKRPHFASSFQVDTKVPKDITCGGRIYDLSHATVLLFNTMLKRSHAVTAYMCNKSGFIFDSNQRNMFPCNWWTKSQLKKTSKDVARGYPAFDKALGGRVTGLSYAYLVYVKRVYAKGINPVCHLRVPALNTHKHVTLNTHKRAINSKNSKAQRAKYYKTVWRSLVPSNRKRLREYIDSKQ